MLADDKDGKQLEEGFEQATYLEWLNSSFQDELGVGSALYYQAIPPRYLQDRFTTAQGDNTRRLYYLTSHLNLEDTNIENWKLLIQSRSASVR